MFGTLNFLFPDRFHSYWGFVEEYFFTSKNINNSGQTYVNVLSLKPDKELELQEFLNKVSTNRKRKDPDVMPWLPEKDYQPVRLPLTKEQLKYIDELETIWETEPFFWFFH
jgi:SNF2 family DNA or RNA helicase